MLRGAKVGLWGREQFINRRSSVCKHTLRAARHALVMESGILGKTRFRRAGFILRTLTHLLLHSLELMGAAYLGNCFPPSRFIDKPLDELQHIFHGSYG